MKVSQKELVEVKSAMEREKNVRLYKRDHSIYLYLSGKSCTEAAKIAGLSRPVVSRIKQTYLREGLSGIPDKPREGRPRRLSEEQEQCIKEMLLTKEPSSVGFHNKSTWAASLVAKYIKREYGFNYTTAGVIIMLERLGFSYMRPDYVLQGEKGIAVCNTLAYKKFEIKMPNEFPFFIKNSYGVSEDSSSAHWHDCFKICLIKNGTGIYVIGEKEYNYKAGDVLIIRKGDIHRAYNHKGVIMQVLMFEPSLFYCESKKVSEVDYLKPFWEVGINFENKLDESDNNHKHIVKTLLEIETEYTYKENGYVIMIKSLLMKLSSLLVRYCYSSGCKGAISDKTQSRAKRFEEILDYININFNKPINLSELCDYAKMSKSNFGLMFKKTFGVTPIEYLVKVRIDKATALLEMGDKMLSDIALQCGFESTNNFISSYKKYTGILPMCVNAEIDGDEEDCC